MSRVSVNGNTWVSVDEAARLLNVDESEVEGIMGRHRMTRKKILGEWYYSLLYVMKRLHG